MTIAQQVMVIQKAMNYLNDLDDPTAMGDATVKHVLEQARFKVEIVNKIENHTELTATRFS